MSYTDQKRFHESQHDNSWCNFFYYLRYTEGFLSIEKFFLAQPSFTLQPIITQQSLSQISTPLKREQSPSSFLPQDISYFLVKDTNVHKETFKEALK